MLSTWEVIARLALAAVCSGMIGFERETSQKSAGLRTHTLVGVGAAVFTIVSIDGFENGDDLGDGAGGTAPRTDAPVLTGTLLATIRSNIGDLRGQITAGELNVLVSLLKPSLRDIYQQG